MLPHHIRCNQLIFLCMHLHSMSLPSPPSMPIVAHPFHSLAAALLRFSLSPHPFLPHPPSPPTPPSLQVNGLFGSPLSSSQLVLAGLQSEATVSGYHADNVAPALMGGFVLVRSYRPLHLLPLAFPDSKQLLFVVVTPAFEAPTKAMRAALPKEVRGDSACTSAHRASVSAIILSHV